VTLSKENKGDLQKSLEESLNSQTFMLYTAYVHLTTEGSEADAKAYVTKHHAEMLKESTYLTVLDGSSFVKGLKEALSKDESHKDIVEVIEKAEQLENAFKRLESAFVNGDREALEKVVAETGAGRISVGQLPFKDLVEA